MRSDAGQRRTVCLSPFVFCPFRFVLCPLPLALCLFLTSCAARLSLPVDPGTTLADFEQIHVQVSEGCRGVRTFTAELTLAGRVGGDRLRGTVHAGFERPSSMRLEGVAPFGPPAFILASRDGGAVLLLPRDARVVRAARPEDVLGALTGVALRPADVMAVLTGCVMPAPNPIAGRVHGNGWASIDLEGEARLYLRRVARAWQLRAATRSGWQIEYPVWRGAFPQVVILRSVERAPLVGLTATIAQFEANGDIGREAFSVDVPASARELTLEELRNAGPLRGQ